MSVQYIISQLVFKFFNFYLFIQAWFDYYKIPRKKRINFLERIKIIYRNNQFSNPRKVCIFVSYSSKLTTSTKKYIETLSEINYSIIHVNNLKTSEKDLYFLSQKCYLCFDRLNIGRDIGAFKDIVLYLKSQGMLDQLDYLCFANDSVQFIPGSFANTFKSDINKFELSDSPALFTHYSYQVTPHFQSFFCILRKDIFLQPSYLKFWKKYIPLGNKEHTILKGEILISKLIYNKIKNPTLLYSTHNLSQAFKDTSIIDQVSEYSFTYLLPSFTRTLAKKLPIPCLDILLEKNPNVRSCKTDPYMFNFIYELIENHNSTHVAAFIYPIYLHCPFIKNDLAISGSYSIGQLSNLYRECLLLSLNEGSDNNLALINKLSDEYNENLVEKGNPFAYEKAKFKKWRLVLNTPFTFNFK